MNAASRFSYQKALKFSINAILDNWKTFLCLTLIWMTGIFLIAGSITYLSVVAFGIPLMQPTTINIFGYQIVTTSFGITARLLIYIGFFIPAILWYFQVLSLGMALSKGESISVGQAFSINLLTFIKFLGARLLLALKYLLGLVLFILPAFYFLSKNYFAGFSIIDNPSLSIGQDASLSDQLTKKVRWRLLLAYYIQSFGSLCSIILLLLTILFLPLFIVFCLVTPFLALIDVSLYNQMKELRSHEIVV